MGLETVEIIPHPESEVEPLKLEELLSSVKDTLSFEIVYSGKYVRLYLVGLDEVLRNLRKSLKTIYGKVIIEEASLPSLKIQESWQSWVQIPAAAPPLNSYKHISLRNGLHNRKASLHSHFPAFHNQIDIRFR